MASCSMPAGSPVLAQHPPVAIPSSWHCTVGEHGGRWVGKCLGGMTGDSARFLHLDSGYLIWGVSDSHDSTLSMEHSKISIDVRPV